MENDRIKTITKSQNPGSVGEARGHLTLRPMVELLANQRLYVFEDCDEAGGVELVVFDYWIDDECWSYSPEEADLFLSQLDALPADQPHTLMFHKYAVDLEAGEVVAFAAGLAGSLFRATRLGSLGQTA